MPVQKKEVYMGSSEVQMKVTEAKRVLRDKKLQSSKECHDSSTAIDLEKENILKYVWKPDFWVTKEIDVHLSLQSGPIAVLKSPCASECRDISMCRKLRRKTEQGYSLNKVQSRTGITSGEIFIDDINKFSRSKFKPNNRSYLPTAKIVVLKPNRGNADSATRSFSSLLSCTIYLIQRGDLFAKESESTIPSSPIVSDRKRQFYNSDGPNKKQISEEWKTTKRFQQVELASRSKTSGVMLSIPDKLVQIVGVVSVSETYQDPNPFLHVLMQLGVPIPGQTMNILKMAEGSNMMVSSDEDNGEGSVNDSEENEGLMRPFRVEESRDFSYLIDVLTEAGFHNRNLDAGFDTWHPQVSYSVFETLEKKYGAVDVLDSQEKEARREYEKFPGKDDGWLELGDDILVIGREIENSLIDELLADVTMESF
ncbi:hypothetical protein GH714_035304 [Hevea brasiliensis]|uniref:DUF4378 domain-containing protein n=1 Tax=Hevea brasiliensis TaxID=3981 RepID=A0A6A6L3F7_HEVBR|nr:hypothetical protein GH714_035304 [Hevea brasiliensis]